MGWITDAANTTAQLANMTTATTPDVTYWEAQAYLQIKNILTGLLFRIPVDTDFTDLNTAMDDSTVQSYGALLVTKSHTTSATLTVGASPFTFIGVGRGAAQITSTSSSSYHLITCSSKTQFQCSNMTLVGGTSATGDLIRVTSSSRCIFTNIEFRGAGTYAIQETSTSDDNIYSDLHSKDFTTAGSTPDMLFTGTANAISNLYINVS